MSVQPQNPNDLLTNERDAQRLIREFGMSRVVAEGIARANSKRRHDLLNARMIAGEYTATEAQAAMVIESRSRQHRTKHLMTPLGEPTEFLPRYLIPDHWVPREWTREYTSSVYFIQHETGGPIKIGISTDPGRRLKSINATTHDPRYRILKITYGGRMREELLHEKFAHLRMHGEWFQPEQDLLDYIAEVRDAS